MEKAAEEKTCFWLFFIVSGILPFVNDIYKGWELLIMVPVCTALHALGIIYHLQPLLYYLEAVASVYIFASLSVLKILNICFKKKITPG